MSDEKSELENKIGLTISEFMEGATKCDLFEQVSKSMELADLKEIWPKKKLVPRWYTEEEYNSVEASTSRADYIREEREIAEVISRPIWYLN